MAVKTRNAKRKTQNGKQVKKVGVKKSAVAKKGKKSVKTEVDFKEELQNIKRQRQVAEGDRRSAIELDQRLVAERGQQRRRLVVAVSFSMVIIFIIWVVVFWHNIGGIKSTEGDLSVKEEWAIIKQEVNKSLDSLKNDPKALEANEAFKQLRAEMLNQPGMNEVDLAKFKAGLFEEKTKDWLVYEDEKVGFTLKYPKDWEVEESGSGFAFSQGDEIIYLVVSTVIMPPELTADKIKDITLDGLAAKRYLDDSAGDGRTIIKVIATLPNGMNDLSLTGVGDTFETMLLTFKLIK